jgi:uncharacterized membrane protein YfcA
MQTFGSLSAVGGLAGALLGSRFDAQLLGRILGALLVMTSVAALTDWVRHIHPGGLAAQGLGLTSGFFGGIAGNQGGLRAGALMAFGLAPAALVATSTATGLAVDTARLPVYLWNTGTALLPLAVPIGVATAGVLAGTFLGERILFGLSPRRFRMVIGGFIGILGIWLLLSPRGP